MTIPINDQLAFRWCLAAAKKGHADCMNDIGIHYENGTGGLDQNLGTAFEWFMKSLWLNTLHFLFYQMFHRL